MSKDAAKDTKKSEKKKMFKVIRSMLFTGSEDAELLEVINEYAHQLRGISPKAAIRNFLLDFLPGKTRELREKNVDRRAG